MARTLNFGAHRPPNLPPRETRTRRLGTIRMLHCSIPFSIIVSVLDAKKYEVFADKIVSIDLKKQLQKDDQNITRQAISPRIYRLIPMCSSSRIATSTVNVYILRNWVSDERGTLVKLPVK